MRIGILYIDVARRFGGTIVSLISRIKHMNMDRFEPLVICRTGPQADAFRRLGVRTEAISAPSFSRSFFNVARVKLYNPFPILKHAIIQIVILVASGRLSAGGGFDIIHGSGLYSNLYASLVGVVFRKPVVWHINDFTIDFQKRLHSFLARRTTRMVAISQAIYEYLVSSKIEKNKIVLIYQPIDCRQFKPMDKADARRRLGLDPLRRIIGFVGRLDPGKGVDRFLLAGCEVLKKHPGALLAITGNGYERSYLLEIRSMVRQLHLKKNVYFLGLRRDVSVVLNALDVLVLPATSPEGFGRVLAEASACGVPVVATDVGGAGEAIKHNETGMIVPPGDLELLVDSVSCVLENRELARRMGVAGRERVKTLFSSDLHQRKLEKLYEEILG